MATELAVGRADQLVRRNGIRRNGTTPTKGRCRGECIAVLSPTVVEVAVLPVRTLD